jgi:hypothetical protein
MLIQQCHNTTTVGQQLLIYFYADPTVLNHSVWDNKHPSHSVGGVALLDQHQIK